MKCTTPPMPVHPAVSGAHWDASLCVSLAHGSGGVRQRLLCHSELVSSVCVSSCGRWLMSGSLDATAMLWQNDPKVRCFTR